MELVRRFESGQQVLQSSGFNDNLPRTLNVELSRGFRVKRGEHNSTYLRKIHRQLAKHFAA